VSQRLIGTDGDDILTGGAADDYLAGGKGNDILKGEGGNDTYYFKIGDGKTQIIDSAGDEDTLIIDGITNPLSLLTQLHVSAQDGGFILELGNDRIDAVGIEKIHINGLEAFGITDLTAEDLIALGSQLG
jgi:Ca2+-binding RTX toxin-like protein